MIAIQAFTHISSSAEYRQGLCRNKIHQTIGLNKHQRQITVENSQFRNENQTAIKSISTDRNFFLLVLIIGQQKGIGVKVKGQESKNKREWKKENLFLIL